MKRIFIFPAAIAGLGLFQSGCTETSSVTSVGAGKETIGRELSIPTTGGAKEKRGFIVSPFARYAGYVDVRNFGEGELVKCPFTGKAFIVPKGQVGIGIVP